MCLIGQTHRQALLLGGSPQFTLLSDGSKRQIRSSRDTGGDIGMTSCQKELPNGDK